MTTETLLGFQLRVDPKAIEAWPASRRERYLLREDVLQPLSVDTTAWSLSKSHPDSPINGLSVYPLDELTGGPSTVTIAVTASERDARRLQKFHKIAEISSGQRGLECFKLLGYDVADHFMCSGLTNCGFPAAQKTELGIRFGTHINEHGLFDCRDAAQKFCLDCDIRVPGHAPFYVYGLWLFPRGEWPPK